MDVSREECLIAERSKTLSREGCASHLCKAASLPKAPPERCSFLLGRSQPACELCHSLRCRLAPLTAPCFQVLAAILGVLIVIVTADIMQSALSL